MMTSGREVKCVMKLKANDQETFYWKQSANYLDKNQLKNISEREE